MRNVSGQHTLIGPLWKSFAVFLFVGAVGACDSLLEVEAPSRVEAEALEGPSNAQLLVANAVTDFECAFAEYIVGAGLLGDELQDSQLGSGMWPYDQRQWNPETDGQYATATCNSTAIGIYTPLSTARWQADTVLERLESWTDAEVENRTSLLATAAAYSGYSHLLLGEGMCSAAFDLGPELTRPEIFERAEDRFTRAIQAAEAAGRDEILNMARVGRARVRLNLGKKAEATADARLVPPDFVLMATYSGVSPRRENDVFTRNIRDESITIEDDFRDLTFKGVPDSRVNVTYAGTFGSDNITELWIQHKYTFESSPIPVATWDEAQLIIAETEGGQVAVDIINMFHERAGLPSFQSSDPDEIMEHIIQERRRELFLESHHLGDVNRYGLQLSPVAGTPYPPKAGGFYGDQTCFPLPDVEKLNNPKIG